MQQGFKDMATRIVQAEDNFIATIMQFGSCTKTEAEKVLGVYRKAKVVKLDAVGGKYHVKHGAYFDAEVIRNAINA